MGGSWEGERKGKKEGGRDKVWKKTEKGKEEKEIEMEGGWTVCTLGRVKCTHMNVQL